MYESIYKYLKSLKAGSIEENFGRHFLYPLIIQACRESKSPKMLDVGAGYGTDLLAIRAALPELSVHAVEGYPRAVSHLRSQNVDVVSLDLERDPLPFSNGQFDVVYSNQVLEHLKEIFWVVGELSRVCKLGGLLVLGVPNLASLHNRIALGLGRQPPAIHVFGPHVRGFTPSGMVHFLQQGNVLRVERVLGSNFYPFPPRLSRPLSRLLPGLSVSSFYVVRKVSDGDFLSVFKTPAADILVDTPYYRGKVAATA